MFRFVRHPIGRATVERHFPPSTLDAIQRAIAESEHRHLGEICFAVEGGLPIERVLVRDAPRERAHAAFARLRVWDTEQNTGVLVYILLADKAIEILADRGIAGLVGDDEWRAICTLMQSDFAKGEYERGALAGVAAITDVLVKHFPANGRPNRDELPNRPLLMR